MCSSDLPSLRKGKEAKFRESKYLELTSKGSFISVDDLARAPSQQKLITLLKEKKEISLKSTQAFGISSTAINALLEKGFLVNLEFLMIITLKV